MSEGSPREGGILDASFGSASSPRRAATVASTPIIRRSRQEAPKTSGFVNNEILAALEGPTRSSTDIEMGSSTFGSPKRSPSTFETHQEIATEIGRDVRGLLDSCTSLTYMTTDAKVFLALVVFTIVLTVVVCILLAVYSQSTGYLGGDTVCVGHAYTQPTMNAMGYSIALQAVNCIFVMWFSVRSVRLEKSWTLLCFVIAAVSQAGRAFYLAFGSLFDTFAVPPVVAVVSQVLLCITALVLLGTFPLAYRVHQGFGWRMYKKGATTAQQVAYMKRYYLMDTVVKVDLMVCVNAFTTMLFVVQLLWLQVAAGVVLGLTVIMLTVVTYFIKKQVKWFVYLLAFICALMPALYIYFLVDQFSEPQQACIPERLVPCLNNVNITIAATNYSADPGAANDPVTQATSLHALFPVGQVSSPPSWFVFADSCTESTPCYNSSVVSVGSCCRGYGQCDVHAELFRAEQGLLLFLAALGLLVRVLTIGTLIHRLRELDDVDVRELLERHERRDIQEFALPLADVASDDDATMLQSRVYSPNTSSPTHRPASPSSQPKPITV